MSMQMQARGFDELGDAFADIERNARQELRGKLKEASILVRGVAQDLTTSRRVRAHLTYDVTVHSLTDFEARLGPTRKGAFFGGFLERGTSHSRAFPFLVPAEEAKEEEVLSLVGEAFELKGGSR